MKRLTLLVISLVCFVFLTTLLFAEEKDADWYNSKGVEYANAGNYEKAIEYFTEAMRQVFDDPSFQEEIKGFGIMLPDDDKIQPKIRLYMYNRGLAFKRLGDTTNAIHDLERSCKWGAYRACELLKTLK